MPFHLREKPPVKEARRKPAPPSWLQRDLKVRFIDKAFKGGKYYNSKVFNAPPTYCILEYLGINLLKAPLACGILWKLSCLEMMNLTRLFLTQVLVIF